MATPVGNAHLVPTAVQQEDECAWNLTRKSNSAGHLAEARPLLVSARQGPEGRKRKHAEPQS